MSLAILKALKPPEVSVKNEIHKRLAGFEEPRPHFPLRASDLMSSRGEFCPREHAFLDMGVASKKGQFIGTALKMTFNHGRFMEEKIRNDYLRDIAVGMWSCGVCGKEHATFGKAPTVKCASCGWGHQWTYQEPRFSDGETDLSGGLDLLLDVGQTKLMVLEIKTMSPDEFKTLVAPLAEHKFRTSLYLKLVAASTWPPARRVNTQEAKILYVTKSFGFKDDTLSLAGIKDAGFSPFKEFTVQRNDALVTTSLSKAKVLKVWRDDRQGMPCGVCQNGLTKRAQSCPTSAACFSGKYPSTLTWRGLDKQPVHPAKKVVELS